MYEWASSWKQIEEKNSKAAKAPLTQ